MALISEQTGLSEQEIVALPPKEFLQLVSQISANQDHTLSGKQLAAQQLASESLNKNAEMSSQTLSINEAKAKNDAALVALAAKDTAQMNKAEVKVVDKSMQAGGVQISNSSEITGQQAGARNILGDVNGKSLNSNDVTNTNSHDVTIKKLAQQGSAGNGEVLAAMQLKDAKLAVSLNANGSLDNSAIAEAKDTTSTHSISAEQKANPLFTATQQVNRNEVAQIQVSIRSQHEGAQQMQDMIQKFSPVMRQQLLTMVSQGIQHAEIRLDPPELGQMMVRIQVQGDQTQVQFQVAQHQTRDIVEQALPRLREMLAEQGMQLTDSDVSQQQQGEEGADGEQGQNGLLGNEMDENTAEETLLAANQATTYQSGIDYYA